MADGKGDATAAAAAAGAGAGAEAPAVAGAGAETESMSRGHRPTSPAPGAPGLRPCLWQLETELREQEVSEVSSLNYCRSFCQTLLQYASNKNASEHIAYLLEVYRLAIQSFASARPFLTTECEDVLLVLGRLVLSCFELLLSVPESELPCEVWVPFLQSLQESHDALLEFGNNNLQILVHVTKEGVWKNPVLLKILSQQPVETEEVNKLIAQEGPSFLQMRIKHLLKSNCIPQATALSKLCAESKELSQVSCFQQAYVTCLCSMLPSEEAIQEIAKVDCKEVLDIICNLESEGQDNTAFILCTTYLTQQLQTASVYCSWELTLFWSKLQRRIDPSLETFLERCRQFGVIAKTQQHLFCLIRVIQTEAQDAGIGVSILLCVRALQLRSSEDEEMKTSVCKTISCLLPEDLEVRRACQLTEFLIEPSLDGFNMLEELYLQPDQKFDEENAPVPNSLRCELLLALKAHWPFDPEFWDWKTLKRHCHQLLGQEASDSDDDLSGYEMSFNDTDILESFLSDYDEGKEDKHYRRNLADQNKEKRDKKPIGSSERYQRWLQYKFFCLLCKRECIEARILHHSKMHMEDGIYTCPVCIKKFKRKELFVPHVMEHVKMPPSRRDRSRKKLLLKGSQRGIYPKSPTRSLEQNQSLSEQAKGESHEYVTFSKLEDCRLQDRDLYPCPGTDCSRVFKQFKYLSVHLKAEHQNNDENAKHYLDMKNRREKCTYCRRHFMSAFHLREHEQVHCGPQPYMCVSIDCYARFGSVNELLNHKQKHDDLRYKCELNGCNIVFSDLGQLYHHEAQHFRDASYTCNVLGCKKFYYSKIEYQDHLSMHNVESPGEELKKSVKLEEPAAGGKQDCVDQPHLLDQIDKSRSPEDLLFCAGSASAHIDTSENLKDNSDSNCSDRLSHSSSTSINEELIDTLDQSETMQDLLLSHEKVFVPSTLKEKCSNVDICFDGTKFTCGFDGCGSTYKNARGIQKHLRKVHPYHCKSRKVKAKDLYTCLSDKHNEADKFDAEPKPSSDTNSDSPDEGLDHSIHAKCKRDHRGYSPEPSICASKRPCTEDTMLELLLRLKHLSLKNSIAHGSFPGSLQGCPSSGAKSLQSVPSSITDLNLQNEDENMPSQYLAQLAAKPFFCELQGCKYEFVTREALLMHYLKKHNYSKEKVLQLSMFQHRYSPFRCHICERSFTRKTHLRIHYKNKHQIGSDRATHRLLDSEKCDHEGPCSVDRLKGDCSAELGPNSNSETPCHSKKDECSSETDLESSCEESESKVSGISSPIGSHREEGEGREGRGSRRTVAKGNLCYILNKYHKPFHCIHKTCNSSFTNLKGLIRHYRTVHQYNKEQLCLEKDKARTKRELVKCKKLFACKYKDCNKRFLCSKALVKHCSDSHNLDHIEESKALSETESAARFSCNQPQCPAVFYSFGKLKHHLLEQHNIEGEIHSDYEIHCTLNGCGQIFSHRSNYFQHVYYRHKDSYDSLFSSQKVANERLLRSEKVCQTTEEQGQTHTQGQMQGQTQGQEQQTAKRPLNTKAKKCGGVLKDKKAPISFKTRAEAIHMCVEHSEHTQYPCMVQGCLSVVKLESSIVRHYKRTHQMNSAYLEQQLENLVVCVKYGTKIKEEPPSEVEPCVKKEENAGCELLHTEHRSPGDSSVPLQNTDSTCPAEQDGGQKRCTERNPALDTDALLYRGSLKCNHTSETTLEQCDTVQSPSCKIENPIPNPCETESGTYFTDIQLPLSRIKEEPGQHSSGQENTVKNATQVPKENIRKHSQPRSFDLKTYKPMGFESSFLKFIQESEEKDDDFDDWEPSEHLPLNNSSQPTNDLTGNVVANAAVNDSDPPVDIPHSSSEPPVAENLTAIAPLVVAEAAAVPSLENLRVVLDKALTDCGELALKQLHYLRPVVVLERSKFSTPILDLFPTKKTDELCVGSS